MKLLELFNEERAVSPVIAVILMVAVTVILAAVIGTFVLGIGSEQDTTPQAVFDFQYDGAANNLTITHAGGDTFETANTLSLDVVIAEAAGGSLTAAVAQGFDVSADVTAGSQAIVTGAESGDEFSVKWTHMSGERSQIVGTYEVA